MARPCSGRGFPWHGSAASALAAGPVSQSCPRLPTGSHSPRPLATVQGGMWFQRQGVLVPQKEMEMPPSPHQREQATAKITRRDLIDLGLKPSSTLGDPCQKAQVRRSGSHSLGLRPLPLALAPVGSIAPTPCRCQGPSGLRWAMEPMVRMELASRQQDAWLMPAPYH